MNSFEEMNVSYETSKITAEDNLDEIIQLLNKIHKEELEYLKAKAELPIYVVSAI